MKNGLLLTVLGNLLSRHFDTHLRFILSVFSSFLFPSRMFLVLTSLLFLYRVPNTLKILILCDICHCASSVSRMLNVLI